MKRLMALSFHLSSQTSYGLPVGGNASRILAEMLLNSVDRLLVANRVTFARFVDDYYIFCQTKEQAHRDLAFLSDSLLQNEGLSLSRTKTRLMTQAEFLRSSPLAEPEVADSQSEHNARSFLRIRLAFDRYSATADIDYDKLRSEVDKYDVLSLLASEFDKSRVDEVLTRQIVKSLRFMEQAIRERAVLSIVENLEKLYPVFSTVSIAILRMIDELSEPTRTLIYNKVRELRSTDSHIMLVPAHLNFAVRILARDNSEEAEQVLVELFNSKRANMMVRRDIVLAMAKRNSTHWISNVLKQYATLTPWEKRSLIVASYILGDEGKHWRKSAERQMSPPDAEFLKWAGSKYNGTTWNIPL